MAFDPNNAQTYFQNFNNLNPTYSIDQNINQQALTDMQAALSYIQSNPSADPDGYLKSTLTQSLAEQNYINQYAQDQNTVSQGSDQLSKINNIISNIQNNNWGNLSSSDFQTLANVMKSSGYSDWSAPISAQYLGNYFNGGGGSDYWQRMDAFKNSLPNFQTHLQQNIDTANKNLTSDQTKAISNFTLAQPDYAGQQKQLSDYYAKTLGSNGQLGTVTLPQTQNIYQTAWITKRNANEQLNAQGLGQSGAKTTALGGIDQKALDASLNNLSSQENKAATNESNLQQLQQGQQGKYADLISGIQGKGMAGMFGNAAQQDINAMNQQYQNQSQQAINQAESDIQTSQQQSNLWNSIAGDVGKFAGAALI